MLCIYLMLGSDCYTFNRKMRRITKMVTRPRRSVLLKRPQSLRKKRLPRNVLPKRRRSDNYFYQALPIFTKGNNRTRTRNLVKTSPRPSQLCLLRKTTVQTRKKKSPRRNLLRRRLQRRKINLKQHLRRHRRRQILCIYADTAFID